MKRPVVGVCCIVVREGAVLLGRRKNCVGEGTWGFPGGHLEGGESWAQCAKRELAEETGMTARCVRYLSTLNIINYKDDRHFVDILMVVEVDPMDEPRIEELEYCDDWSWHPINDLPFPLMQGTEAALGEYQCQ